MKHKWVVLTMATFTRFLCVSSRDVPALQDLCARAAWSFCSGSQTQRNQRPPAADVPPSNSAPSASSGTGGGGASASKPKSVAEYCSGFEPHFTYYCGGDAKEPKASDFCSDYLANCLSIPAAGAGGGGQGGGTASGPAAGAASGSGGAQPAVVPCSAYTPQYTRYCTRVVSNPQIAQFCQNYLSYCVNVPTSPPTPPPQQLDESALAATQIKEKCAEYQTAAKLYCTGPVTKTESAQAKRYCDLFRQYCVNTGFGQLNRRRRYSVLGF